MDDLLSCFGVSVQELG